MKQNILLLMGVVLLSIFLYPTTTCANDSGNEKKPLVVIPSELTIAVGKSKDFIVKCTEEKNAQVDKSCSWQVLPDSLGVFAGSEFMAKAQGSGSIIVVYKNFSDTIALVVTSHPNGGDDGDEMNGKYPMITFEENRLVLSVGDSETISPVYRAAEDSSVEVDFVYAVHPAILGTISSDGVFHAEHMGNGKIIVSFNHVFESINVQVKKEFHHDDAIYPALDIATKRVNIKVGEYVELMAVYTDSAGNVTTVSPEWSVQPAVLGHFTDSVFYADSVGKGFILAEYAGLSDSIPLNVQFCDESDNVWSKYLVVIEPSDTTIAIGDSVQYTIKAYNKNNWHLVIDSTLLDSIDAEWSVVGPNIGTITEDGLFTASERGFALIKAKLNGGKAITTRVLVDEAISDSTGINTVEIQRVLPNGNILPPKTVKEGCAYKIGGLPFPLNLLNGGLLYFPVGSLKEDISIFMMLPEQIKEDSSGVVMSDSVFAGVKFVVAIGDSIIEPYYFEKPLILSIPYKAGLLDSLGIDPEKIGMFFSEDGDYSTSGIENVVIDTVGNRITADVVHFSSFVVRKGKSVVVGTEQPALKQTIRIVCAPNPFINETTIQFNVERGKKVDFRIYDLKGRLVHACSFGKAEGNYTFTWNATDKSGTVVNQGIYIGKLFVDGKSAGTGKMLKLK